MLIRAQRVEKFLKMRFEKGTLGSGLETCWCKMSLAISFSEIAKEILSAGKVQSFFVYIP